MSDLVLYVPIAELIKSAGKTYKQVLDDLVKDKVIISHKAVVEVIIDKTKARHFQTVMAFYDIKDTPAKPTTTKQYED